MNYRNPVLLAEDDDDDSLFFAQAVRDIDPNIQLIRYRDGMELLNRIDEVPMPGVLFLDVNMPKTNGYECLINLRADIKYKNLPIVIFSTSGSADFIIKLKEAGANDFIIKPNDFNLWKSTIERVIEAD